MDNKMRCRYCQQVVGVFDECARELGQVMKEYYPTEYCYGEHQRPVRFTRVHCCGLVRDVRMLYPDTNTEERWSEYIGPRNRFLVWLALQSVPGSLLFDDAPLCWGPRSGFFGSGFGKMFAQK